MGISKTRAIELIDEVIAQFQEVLEKAVYHPWVEINLYKETYWSAYRGAMSILAEIWSADEAASFRSILGDAESTFQVVAESDLAEGALESYKAHIGKCIALLRIYRKRIEALDKDELTKPRPNMRKRKLIEGWLDKASKQKRTAEEHLNSGVGQSESIQASQECIELSVKSILELLNIDYPRKHSWTRDQLGGLAKQIHERALVDKLAEHNLSHMELPRLLLLANLWGHLYVPAKYGYSDGYLAAAHELFRPNDAKLALEHATECYAAASELADLDDDKLSAIASQ